jgi:cytochrome c peroxidase
MRINTSLLLMLLIVAVQYSCNKEIEVFKTDIQLNLPENNYDYVNGDFANATSVIAQNIPDLLTNSGVTNEGATLGRVLFYDKQLSLNNRISCASCHAQKDAFADRNTFSIGFEDKITPRNSMAIVNPILNNSLFWDSRANSIEELVSQPIQNHIEMGMESINELVTKLSAVDYYKPLFLDAYATDIISEDKIVDAMSQFLRSMVSIDSKFDNGMASNFSNYSELEEKGRAIFFSDHAKCSTCHSGVNLSAPDGAGAGSALAGLDNFMLQSTIETDEYAGPTIKGTANIGLDFVYADNGFRDGQFKIPTLRNIALTGPYMHDGRYNSLEEVVEHYSSQIKFHENLDDKFVQNGKARQLNFSNDDKKALVAFLQTLTDESFISADRFSDPFMN